MKRSTLISVAFAILMIALAATPRSLAPVGARTVLEPQEVATVPFYRLFAHTTGIHFYTIDVNRKQEAMGGGWSSEGVAAHILNQQAPGTVPLYVLVTNYRFDKERTHGDAVFGYTTNEQERDTLLNSPYTSAMLGGAVYGGSKWILDATGIAGYIAATPLPGTVPLYRLYHPPDFGPDETEDHSIIAMANFSHFRRCLFNAYDNLYTTNEKEKASALKLHGYKFVRIEGYVWPQPTTVSMLPPAPPKPAGPKIVPGSNPTANPDTDLLKGGCTRTGVGSYNCPTVSGYEACQAYKKNGKVQACATNADLSKQAAMDKELFSLGCTRFLGRPDEFICKTQKSFDACEVHRKNASAKRCAMAKQ
ncbi:MAG TPA: hypothetical protein VJT50_09615 [Pyrinomonadaceae bacterium]|nr:hypothetical protein [Pyrinomonadaceae bacterium]